MHRDCVCQWHTIARVIGPTTAQELSDVSNLPLMKVSPKNINNSHKNPEEGTVSITQMLH